MKAVTEWSPRCVTPDVSGAVLLMQRELQWYKILEDRSDPSPESLKLLEDPLTEKRRRRKTYWEVFVVYKVATDLVAQREKLLMYQAEQIQRFLFNRSSAFKISLDPLPLLAPHPPHRPSINPELSRSSCSACSPPRP